MCVGSTSKCSNKMLHKCSQVFNIASTSKMQLTFNEAVNYGCSFVAKLSWKKNVFWKNICVFTKYTFFADKNIFIW